MISRILAVSAFVAALALSGCANTVRGVGQDVKQTGRAVADVIS